MVSALGGGLKLLHRGTKSVFVEDGVEVGWVPCLSQNARCVSISWAECRVGAAGSPIVQNAKELFFFLCELSFGCRRLCFSCCGAARTHCYRVFNQLFGH